MMINIYIYLWGEKIQEAGVVRVGDWDIYRV